MTTPETDMNEARASERADLVELQREHGLLKISHEQLQHLFKQADDCAHEREKQILALSREVDRLRAELSRASATAQEPADTKAENDFLKAENTRLRALVPQWILRSEYEKLDVHERCTIRYEGEDSKHVLVILGDVVKLFPAPPQQEGTQSAPVVEPVKCACKTKYPVCKHETQGSTIFKVDEDCMHCGHKEACHAAEVKL